MAETIQDVSLADETSRRYIIYALSVITGRALPDVRDGLKPVQRRILFTMWNDLRLTFDGRPAKCARIVGDVMGKYHPHGDMAVYDALVRLAQNWVMRAPLVDGQGNFGSVDGDPPAAYRYTEAKLSRLAVTLMEELRQDTVAMRPTFDNSKEEPVVLPSQYPNLLVNGTSGIAVGLATNIPPHNLGEVVRAAVHLVDNPEATTAELMQRVKGPDFPLGGKIVTDRATLRRIYEEGDGSIKLQSEWKVEDTGKRRELVITSIPYGEEQDALERQIGDIIADRKLPQVLGLTKESSEKEGIRLTMELKAGADAQVVMAYLYKHTGLQKNISYNMTCLVPTENGLLRPEKLGLKGMLRHFLDFRLATVRKRYEFELAELRRRIHILDGFRIIFDGLDKALKLIRESKGKADAAERLIAAFPIDEIQANAVLDAQIYKIAQLEISRILTELKEKRKSAAEIEALLASESRLWNVVKTEMAALAETYADRRRTRMASDEDVLEFDESAYIVRENTNVVLTRDGWIKRVGRLASVETTRVREGDEVIAVAPGSTLDHVIFLADDGSAYTMRMNEVPASSGYGEPIAKFFKLADQVRIMTALSTDERFLPPSGASTNGEPSGPYLLAVASSGYVLRTPVQAFRTASTKVGRRFMRLEEGARVVMAAVPTEETSVMLATERGRVIHFALDEVSILAGVGKGVLGIKLDGKDVCLGGALIGNRHDALVVETAGGRTMEYRRGAHPITGRGGKGAEVVKRTSFTRVVPPVIELVDWDAVGEPTQAKPKETEKTIGKNGDGPTLFG